MQVWPGQATAPRPAKRMAAGRTQSPQNRPAPDSDRGDAIDLHVERAVPGRHADEAARRRVRREIPRVNRIDRLEMRRVRAIHGALDDPVERRAGLGQAELHLLEHDLGLAFDRQALDLAGGRIVRRDVRHKDEIAAPHGHADRDFAGFGIGGQRLDANGLSIHGYPSYLSSPCGTHAPQCWQQSRPLSFPISSARAEPSLLADGAAAAVKSPMVAAANLVEVAALVGDTARATILAALMGGQALTGSELAYLARVSRPTASEHLLKLVEARLVAVTKQGRYRYYRIASPLVARMLESIIAVAAIEVPSRYQPRSIRDDALRFARTCYDHLAGQVGVAITDSLVANGHIVLTEDGGEVTDAGARFLTEFGADLRSRGKRIFCRPCLDWSERRYHVAGLVGAEIWRRCLGLGWLMRERDSRALRLTAAGKTGLSETFGIDLTSEGLDGSKQIKVLSAAEVRLRA